MPRTFIDVTQPISERLPVWPGDQPVGMASSRDELPRITRLSLGSHTGTHLDAPAHFFPDGATVESLPLDVLIGPAWVVHVPGREPITAEELAGAVPAGTTRLLIRTGNPAPPPAAFDPAYVALGSRRRGVASGTRHPPGRHRCALRRSFRGERFPGAPRFACRGGRDRRKPGAGRRCGRRLRADLPAAAPRRLRRRTGTGYRDAT